MSRIQNLVSSPKRTLAALATVLVAVGITTASGADFGASSANATNTFATGTLSMSNTPNMTTLNASNMRPGDPATTGTVMIENTGSLSGSFSVKRSALNDSDSGFPMSAKLNLVLTDCGVATAPASPSCGDGDDVVVPTGGTIAALGTGPHALGTYAPGARHLYRFSVALDSSADDDYQGDSSAVNFTWNATS
jgi:hypothetical protein